MCNKNEVFEYLIDQLRQQLPVVDVMGEIKRWSIDRSIVGRGNYTDEENAIIDVYIGQEHNPYKRQCEDLAHEVQSLKNQLRDALSLVAELQKELGTSTSTVVRLRKEIAKSTGDIGEYIDATEQSGCRKNDTQECEHEWRTETLYGARVVPTYCRKCGVYKQKDEKNDTQECEHEWSPYYDGRPTMRRLCGKCGKLK